MCIVSFIPVKNGFVVTSNRDEARNRGITTHAPTTFYINGIAITCPIDTRSGGTWIGYNQFNHFAVLLNGGKTKHEKQAHYLQSRGLIIPNVLSLLQPVEFMLNNQWLGIEPFTLWLIHAQKFWEFVWTGKELLHQNLSMQQTHIRCSITLYHTTIGHQIAQAFQASVTHLQKESDILAFHKKHLYEHTVPTALQQQQVQTVSTTQYILQNSKPTFNYHPYLIAAQ